MRQTSRQHETPLSEGAQTALQSLKTQTKLPSFEKWFEGSQVVDEAGEALVCFHGTDKAFTTFRLDRTMDTCFWFTSDSEKLGRGEAGASASGVVISVYLACRKLAGWDEYERLTLDQLIQEGFDGVKLDDDFIVFDPKAIKSATSNCGAFDPLDPDIRA